ncbi:MAG TPA: GAF domain-containing protein [Candidatus Sulfotelmatobacter sp.]|nr:GAF domain-containing protein [Candidatus Sulfotelmatobacter sp.]
MEKGIVSEEKKKPVLDEQTLAKLLEAAYVLQEHNRELRELELGLDLKRDKIEAEAKSEAKTNAKSAPEPAKPRGPAPTDYTFTLAQIVATQHQIQIRNLELEKAMALVTERVMEIARAGGAAIGILDGKQVRYRAVFGSMTLRLGTEVPTEKALCQPCIRNAQVFRCADVNPEFLVDSEECRRRGIQSLIAVPIFHEGVAAGGLELYYAAPHGFSEQDAHTCQLMAGLVTEALARDEEHTWKQSLASERAAMLEAIEKLKPNLSALAEQSSKQETAPKAMPIGAPQTQAIACAQCGNKFSADEQFCGQCGSPRSGTANMQSKVASLLRMQETPKIEIAAEAAPALEVPHETTAQNSSSAPTEESLAMLQTEIPDFFTPYEIHTENRSAIEAPSSPSSDLNHEIDSKDKIEEPAASEEELAITKVPAAANWNSAASAREFLEQLTEEKPRGALARFWNARRGDIYLAVAVILVACVIRWGIWSNHPVSATNSPNATVQGHRKPAPIDPTASLSLFDRMLISLGLADTPEVPEDKGDPSVRVWVDLHTALYYCPGTDLYGKTPRGKYASQRDAQLDEYQPAYRKPCN